MSTSHHRPSRRPGFTLVEMLVVIAIIALLVGILLPALSAVRARAKKLAANAQLQSVSAACDSYYTTFQAYPGYAPESAYCISGGNQYQKLSGNENLVISLLGQVVTAATTTTAMSPAPPTGSTPSGYQVDVSKVGEGPRTTNGHLYGAFYAPKDNQLQVIKGGAADNNMYELVESSQSGLPILYFRANPASGASILPVAKDYISSSVYFRSANYNYISASALKNASGSTYDETNNSMIFHSVAGTSSAAETNLAWVLVDSNTSDLSDGPNGANDNARGGYALMASGPDGIYMNKSDNGGTGTMTTQAKYDAYQGKTDDVVVIGGTQ